MSVYTSDTNATRAKLFVASGGQTWGLWNDGSALKPFVVGGFVTEWMRIDATGAVGIGTNNPNTKLHVKGFATFENGSTTTATSRNSGVSFWTDNAFGGELHYGTGSQSSGWATALYGRATETVALRFGAYSPGATAQNTLTEYMTILNSGNVGIGSTSPVYKLDVNGDARINGNLILGDASNDTVTINAGTFNITSNVNFDSNTLYIDSVNNRVGIGTAAPVTTLDTWGYIAANGADSITSNPTSVRSAAGWKIGMYGSGYAIGVAAYTTAIKSGGWLSVFSGNPANNGTATTPDTSATVSLGTNGNVYAGNFQPTLSNVPQNGMYLPASNVVGFSTNLTERVRVDSNGNFGIGTISPRDVLDIQGTPVTVGGQATGNLVDIVNKSTAYNASPKSALSLWTKYTSAGGIYPMAVIQAGKENTTDGDNAGYLSFLTVANSGTWAEKMRIDSTGKVGIATTSPNTLLDVRGVITAGSATSTSGSTILQGYYSNGALVNLGSEYSSGGTVLGYGVTPSTTTNATFLSSTGIALERSIYVQNNSGHLFYYGGSQTVTTGNVVTVSEVMRIDNAGRVGIGTTSPVTKLHVKGTWVNNEGILQIDADSGTQYSGLTMQNNGTAKYYIYNDNTNGINYIGSAGTEPLVFGYNATSERMRIDSSGNVGIGTSTVTYKLQVNGSFAATTKSFVIDHPTKPGKKLRYGSLESPYHGIRLTGKDTVVDGKCIVKLPDYIYALCKEEGVNIQITNIRHGKIMWVDDINIGENEFTICTDSNSHYEFYWTFTAVRKDIDDMIVEFDA